MKILFVKPSWPYPYSKGDHTYNRIWPPLCLMNCAAIAEQMGHEAQILDAHALRLPPNRIPGHIACFDKIFITSSALDRWQCPNIDVSPFLEMIQNLQGFNKEIYGMGWHGTIQPEMILRQTQATAVIRGEPEETVRDLCDGKNLSDIPGISYLGNKGVTHNPDRADVELTALPTPAYHLINMKKYFYELLGDRFALLETTRGCPRECYFCNKIMYGKKIRSKSLNQIQDDIRTVVERYGARTGYFIDLDFLSQPEITGQVCDFLIRKNYRFRWCCQTRPDACNGEMLRKMKKSGCRLIHLGIESGVQDILDRSAKNLFLDKASEAVKICRDLGIETLGFYLFDFKGETAREREATWTLAKKLDTTYASFHRVILYGENQTGSTSGISGMEIDKFIRHCFLKYYLRFSRFGRINIFVALRCLKLFFIRLKSIPS